MQTRTPRKQSGCCPSGARAAAARSVCLGQLALQRGVNESSMRTKAANSSSSCADRSATSTKAARSISIVPGQVASIYSCTRPTRLVRPCAVRCRVSERSRAPPPSTSLAFQSGCEKIYMWSLPDATGKGTAVRGTGIMHYKYRSIYNTYR